MSKKDKEILEEEWARIEADEHIGYIVDMQEREGLRQEI